MEGIVYSTTGWSFSFHHDGGILMVSGRLYSTKSWDKATILLSVLVVLLKETDSSPMPQRTCALWGGNSMTIMRAGSYYRDMDASLLMCSFPFGVLLSLRRSNILG